MSVSKLTEQNIIDIKNFINKFPTNKQNNNFLIGVSGEVAFHNYGINNKLFSNFYGNDLNKSIFKQTDHADLGHDYIIQSLNNKYKRLFVQVKTTALLNGHNIPLDKRLYDSQLNYYNNIQQDIFVFVKKLSKYEFDICGFITKEDAIKYYEDEKPIKGCYCINQKWLKPIENIVNLLQ